MEEPNQEPDHHNDLDAKCPARKLDFNLPLLSTRRQGRYDDAEQLSCTTAANSINLPHHDQHRIPFCWERAPGRPKRPVNDADEDYTPRLRLPPCRWHPAAIEINDNMVTGHNDAEDRDDGNDADVDESEGDYNNNYSNAYMDALSLTEAIDIAQRGDGDGGGESGLRERFSVSSRNCNDSGAAGGSPNFMMERFLPDATALAASSVLYATNKMLPFYTSAAGDFEEGYGRSAHYSCSPAVESSSVVSQKGCGLDVLFPWRTKHKLCNAKSPVRQVVLPSPAQPPRLGTKQKKDHRSADKGRGDISRHVQG